ncbi:MAG: M14 family zinc carboxypeptidase [bacterium]|nr:M14 family zinc carboxypeptidase [bacterium]
MPRKVIVPVVIVILGIGAFVLFNFYGKSREAPSIVDLEPKWPQFEVIGQSVEGRKIESYTYGDGDKYVLFVGGIHGGYEWNSVLLAYQFIDYLAANPTTVPPNLTIAVIPSANPDGVYRVVSKEGRFTSTDVSTDKETLASGRFNAHKVDLNRNFDCNWKPTSLWREKTVSAGSEPFSEPEAMALRTFVLENKPDAVIFWHSQSNAVYASECQSGILPETLDIMNAYSRASGYQAVKSFDSYDVTGDSEGWLASIGIPSITVELKDHENIEWEKNLAGIKAILGYYLTK